MASRLCIFPRPRRQGRCSIAISGGFPCMRHRARATEWGWAILSDEQMLRREMTPINRGDLQARRPRETRVSVGPRACGAARAAPPQGAPRDISPGRARSHVRNRAATAAGIRAAYPSSHKHPGAADVCPDAARRLGRARDRRVVLAPASPRLRSGIASNSPPCAIRRRSADGAAGPRGEPAAARGPLPPLDGGADPRGRDGLATARPPPRGEKGRRAGRRATETA